MAKEVAVKEATPLLALLQAKYLLLADIDWTSPSVWDAKWYPNTELKRLDQELCYGTPSTPYKNDKEYQYWNNSCFCALEVIYSTALKHPKYKILNKWNEKMQYIRAMANSDLFNIAREKDLEAAREKGMTLEKYLEWREKEWRIGGH